MQFLPLLLQPNTSCLFDRHVPAYNRSCQCIPGNKPFDPEPRTGLVEGCAPLTDADKASTDSGISLTST